MVSRRQFAWLAGILSAGASLPHAAAQDTATDGSAAREKKLKAGEAEAKRLLLLMDADQNGKVSRNEFMKFMEAEFNRLDKNGDGELDVRELTQSRLSVHAGGGRR